MSHNCGRVVGVGTRVGPDSGPATSAGVWELLFTPSPALAGGNPRFVMLHFSGLSFPGAARMEVELGYATDRFDAASGSDGWTRPINPALGPIRIRYFGAGAVGGATLTEYASGEPTQTGVPGAAYGSITDPDLFLQTNPYVEPTYETRLKCGVFDWQNAACAAAGSVEEEAAKAVCCFFHVDHEGPVPIVSSCSATLIDNNLVLTASHCATDPGQIEARSGSVCFGYQTTCAGGRPAGYAPKIFKVTRIVRRGSADWLILEIDTPPGGTGITPAVLRSSSVLANEDVIAIHHPHGAVKKFQRRRLVSNTVYPVEGFDFAGGSSGSALFDSLGRIVGGALSAGPLGDACRAGYTAATTIVQELANPVAPPTPFDVILVMDRSGSMASPGILPGRTKMQEARDAASLFVQLVRRNVGDQLGLVSFSTSAARPADSARSPVNDAKKLELVGVAPYVTGKIGGLAPGGMTSIGDGLSVAIDALTPASANQRAILLMTDGLQNTPPMIAAVEGGLGPIKLVTIGFGAESNLDSALLSRVARAHNGLYTRANDGLDLKKFFSLAFGNIFEAGALSDPNLVLRKGEQQTPEQPFEVCEEERITAVVGWDDPSQTLELTLRTPLGTPLTVSSAGIVGDRGETWQFLRVELPFAGERAGTWHWQVSRLGGGGEFPPPQQTVRLFVTVVADGGPRLEPILPAKPIYTGDPLNPLVALRHTDGTAPRATVTLELEAPDASVGQLVTDAGLAQPEIGDDPLSAFHATLKNLAGGGSYSLPTRQEQAELFDDGEHDDGAMEPDGTYGNLLPNLTRYEGTYRFHARARYGTTCTGLREAQWAIHVELGIDPAQTTVDLVDVGDAPGGRQHGKLVIRPRDRYGNPLGPGRGENLDLSGLAGTTAGPAIDNGDGSYTIETTWDPSSADQPSVVVAQPERPPIILGPASGQPGKHRHCRRWIWALLLLLILLLIALAVILILEL